MDNAMTWQVVAAALGGFVGQVFKAAKNVPTWLPQLGMWLLGFVVYVAFNPPKEDGWALGQYLLLAAVSALSVNGMASVVGTHPALKTDSK